MSNHDWVATDRPNKNNTHKNNRSTHNGWDAGSAWNPQSKKRNECGIRNTDWSND